jgi:hypothetical protein
MHKAGDKPQPYGKTAPLGWELYSHPYSFEVPSATFGLDQ